jgi:hypothetical protein
MGKRDPQFSAELGILNIPVLSSIVVSLDP